MIDLTHERVERMGREIASLPLFGCWAEVVSPKTSHHELLRVAAWRRGDGSWHLTVEELDDSQEEKSPHLQWGTIMRDWVRPEIGCGYDARSLAETVADEEQNVHDALDLIVGYVYDKEIESDPHPGSWLLDWVWEQP